MPVIREVVDVNGTIGPTTAKAVRVVVENRTIWIPFASVIEIHQDEGRVVVDKKFADKEGL